MVQWTYLCVIFHVKHKTYHFRGLHLISKSSYNLRWRPRWWQLLVTSQASSSATIHKIYLTLLRRSTDFHWRQNHLEILQHMKNFREGFHQRPPPPMYHGGGMNLHVLPRVTYIQIDLWIVLPAENTPILSKLVFVPCEFNWPVISTHISWPPVSVFWNDHFFLD